MQKGDKLYINRLLNKLNASPALRKNVSDILKYHSATLEIYPNTVINALSIALNLKQGSINVAFISPMQSGKSGSVFFLNYVLTEIGFLRKDQNILFLTSMRDTDLYDQNVKNLQSQYFDCVSRTNQDSRIYVMKIDEIFKYPNPYQIVRERNIGLFVRDEDHYGAGIDSTFDCGFMQELRAQLPHMPLVSVSATPFDLIDASKKGYDLQIVNGAVPANYFGIAKMLSMGLVEDIADNFSPFTSKRDSKGRTVIDVSRKFHEYMRHLISFKDGLGIIRVSKSDDAFTLRTVAQNKYGADVTVLVIGSDSGCDYKISHGMQQVKYLVNTQCKRVLLIVVNALSAGKDFQSLKEKIRFGIETRKSQLANGAQGIPGRICGYHNNTSFKLLASKTLLEKYSQFEQNPEIILDENWRNELLLKGVKNLSTQVGFELKSKEKEIIPIQNDPQSVDFKELKTPIGRRRLHFLDDEAYKQLLKVFDESIWYHETPFRLKSKKSQTTIRVASAYNAKDNRVYKLWGKYKKGQDFGDVMFKKKSYQWGLLISNIPARKTSKSGIKNEIGFRGIEIYKAGNKVQVKSSTLTNNQSMYNK